MHIVNIFSSKLKGEFKRLDSISRSPVFSHFSETIDGVSTIRAFKHNNRFIDINDNKLDKNVGMYFLMMAANCWLGVRLELVGAFLTCGSALCVVLAHPNHIGDAKFAGLAGLSVSMALGVTQALNWMLRKAGDLETQIVSVERINYYADGEREAPHVIKDKKPSEQWPHEGKIVFDKVQLKYRPDLPLVLKNISLTIPSCAKVGLVGRTGKLYSRDIKHIITELYD